MLTVGQRGGLAPITHLQWLLGSEVGRSGHTNAPHPSPPEFSYCQPQGLPLPR